MSKNLSPMRYEKILKEPVIKQLELIKALIESTNPIHMTDACRDNRKQLLDFYKSIMLTTSLFIDCYNNDWEREWNNAIPSSSHQMIYARHKTS